MENVNISSTLPSQKQPHKAICFYSGTFLFLVGISRMMGLLIGYMTSGNIGLLELFGPKIYVAVIRFLLVIIYIAMPFILAMGFFKMKKWQLKVFIFAIIFEVIAIMVSYFTRPESIPPQILYYTGILIIMFLYVLNRRESFSQ